MRHKSNHHIVILYTTTLIFLSPYICHAQAPSQAMNIGKKILRGAGSTFNSAGAILRAVELFCKTAKGRSRPSKCEDLDYLAKNEMTTAEQEDLLQTFLRQLRIDKKQEFLKALYDELTDEGKQTAQSLLTKEESVAIGIKISRPPQETRAVPVATKSIRSIADKIIARKTFSIQLIYCDNAKQAACNGKKLPMGSIQCGANYKVRYDHPVRSFEVTGLDKGSGQQQTSTYSGAKVEDGQVSLWGRFLIFDEEGDIFDSDCGRVGRLAFE